MHRKSILNFVDNHKKNRKCLRFLSYGARRRNICLVIIFFTMPMKYFNDPIYVKQIEWLMAFCLRHTLLATILKFSEKWDLKSILYMYRVYSSF
jgi:hypothetical protein